MRKKPLAQQMQTMIEYHWTDSEKKIARRAFDAAFSRENSAILAELKRLAAKAEKPEDIREIYSYLTKKNKSVAGKYDYRYSQLILVFARLLREKWLEEKDLEGLSEDKLRSIKNISSF